MNGSLFSNGLAISESLLCVVALSCVLFRRQGQEYKFLCTFLAFRAAIGAFILPLLMFAGHGIERHLAYKIYFYTYWANFAVESRWVISQIA